ncbi:MAG: C40 family peptidase [Gemmatimonadales bacterium]
MRFRSAALWACLWSILPSSLEGQGLEGQVGRFYEGGGWTLYRVGFSRPLRGIIGYGVHGSYLARAGDAEGGFAGVGLDLTGFRGTQGPYLVAGVGGGIGSPRSYSFSSFWGSWSAGAGYHLFPASFFSVGVEGRWRELSLDARDGLELSAGISIRFGGRSAPSPATPRSQATGALPVSSSSPAPLPERTSPPGSTAALADSVIATAIEAMGRPYRYGGTGKGGGGFDCSGLIQHAYGQHGITLPRRSVDQAREGREVSKKLDALAPGDLLTFANGGKTVTHVGLYLGDGLFVHSASRGVQVSTLSDDDPYGRWWYKRWVGVRRIVE